MTLAEQMAADGVAISRTSDLGETIQYHSGGQVRPVQAVVKRKSADFDGRIQIDVFIPNDPVAGVTVIDRHEDRIELPINIGGSATKLRIGEIVDQSKLGFTVRATAKQVK